VNLGRLFAIVLKELRQLRRDRLTFAMIIGIPTMQLVLFGYAINLDVRHLQAAVFDAANTAQSREIVAAIEASGVVDFTHKELSAAEVDPCCSTARSARP
jgi:ABC-2 type transport system permease protein